LDPLAASLTSELTRDEVDALTTTTVDVSASRSLSLIDLLTAWSRHVEKIDSDRGRSFDDRSVWVAHDFVAALAIRDFVEEGRDSLDATIQDKIEQYLQQVDSKFRAVTQDDSRHLVGRVAERDVTTKAWWWRRVPESGPVLQDMQNYARSAED